MTEGAGPGERAAAAGRPVPSWWLALVFLEGYASLAIEVIALRRLVPHMGSAITVTAPTIGLFLLALTWGYWTGGRRAGGEARRVRRNFLVAAVLAGLGLSRLGVDLLFAAAADPVVAYLVLMAGAVCLPAGLLAQTVPLMANLFRVDHAGAASGQALTASTLGSFLGALSISLVIMPRWGVSAAVTACAGALLIGAALVAMRDRSWVQLAVAATLGVALVAMQRMPHQAIETTYADYQTLTVTAPAALPPGAVAPAEVLLVNQQRASLLDASEPPRRAPYIERMSRYLRTQWPLPEGRAGRDILVLGAGGFTLSLGDTANAYTYVDIDPDIRDIAEKTLLKQPITGRFVAADARQFVVRAQERYDAVVVDVYSAHAAVPSHLVTREFWAALPRVLHPGGSVLVNLILPSDLGSDYARNLLGTLESALGRCAVEVLDPFRPISNVVVICRPRPSAPAAQAIYTDELNRVELDRNTRGY